MKHKVYLLFGSNLGDRIGFIQNAIREIEFNFGKVLNSSSLYESPAWGFYSSEKFLNQVVLFETILSPEALLDGLLGVEKKLGRKRKEVGYSSRKIDIDILYFDNLIVEKSNLSIPHPRLHQRRFVLLPLSEIAPDYKHPVLRMTTKEMLEHVTDTAEVKLLKLTMGKG